MTGFYLKIPFKSDTETHKAAFFASLCADFNRKRRETLERKEGISRNEMEEMKWRKYHMKRIEKQEDEYHISLLCSSA